MPKPRKQPYNPAASGSQKVHDRRASSRDINRGVAGHVLVVEVDDPFEPGARITAVRSMRGDVLADRFHRDHIDEAQYEAGRLFQKYFQLAERGPRAVHWPMRSTAIRRHVKL